MNTKARLPVLKNDSRKMLTSLESKCTLARMARFRDILNGLTRQTENDAKEIHAMNDEMNTLHSAYLKYKELAERIKGKDERLRITVGLIASVQLDDPEEDYQRDGKLSELCENAGVPVPTYVGLEVYKHSMWKLIREIVRQTPEMQIVELENALHRFGAKTTRQAIESALETHRKDFRIVKRGRDKFVSLKGA